MMGFDPKAKVMGNHDSDLTMNSQQQIALFLKDQAPTMGYDTAGTIGKILATNNVITHCACYLPCQLGQQSCDACLGKNTIQIEGAIFKKKKKEGGLKRYWYLLLDHELYSYKKESDVKHTEVRSIAGVYIKSSVEEIVEDGVRYYPLMLIFPDKRRIYYLSSLEEKDRWVNAIKQVVC
jgi:hypothetical protein